MGRVRRRPALLALALAPLLGCPPDQSGQGLAPPGSAATAPTATSQEPAPPADPLQGSVFTREQLFELYRAERMGDPERARVLRLNGLLDASGQEVPARVRAYEAALQQYATNDPQGWSEFVETLPE